MLSIFLAGSKWRKIFRAPKRRMLAFLFVVTASHSLLGEVSESEVFWVWLPFLGLAIVMYLWRWRYCARVK